MGSRPNILQYHTAPAGPRQRAWLRGLFFAGAVPAAVVPFVDFTWSTSPLDVLIYHSDWELYSIALPFFLGLPITLWKLRLLIKPDVTAAEWVIAYVLAALTVSLVLCFLGLTVKQLIKQEFTYEILIVQIGAVAVLLAGAAAMWWLRRRGLAADVLPTIAMHTAYLSNAFICLWAFADLAELGWWLTLVASISFASEVLMNLLARWR